MPVLLTRYANDRAQLLEVLASDCGCALHAEGCGIRRGDRISMVEGQEVATYKAAVAAIKEQPEKMLLEVVREAQPPTLPSDTARRPTMTGCLGTFAFVFAALAFASSTSRPTPR